MIEIKIEVGVGIILILSITLAIFTVVGFNKTSRDLDEINKAIGANQAMINDLLKDPKTKSAI
jgi:hypothetical protein